MKLASRLPALLLALLLGVCVLAYYQTGKTNGSAGDAMLAAAQKLVDTSLFENVTRMASLAAPTPEEQGRAREAYLLADHELDLAFAAALRQAEATPVPATGFLRNTYDQIASLKTRVADDKNRVTSLGKDDSGALELAKAQLDLDQDELDEATQAFKHAGGDQRSKVERLLEEHEASSKDGSDRMVFPKLPATGTLSEQFAAWLSIAYSQSQLLAAAQSAAIHASALQHRRFLLEQQPAAPLGAPSSVADLRVLANRQKDLAVLDQRVDNARQLAVAYQGWSAVTLGRERAALHLLLRSVGAILAILLVTLLINNTTRGAFQAADARRLHQMRTIVRIASQVAAVLLILVIVFGLPTRFLATIIGLATAGLTVVTKDYIVAFFGWFRLTGMDGISLGDWVEIEGVSGEVSEIGLLKTVLLEHGSGTEVGQTTGRRVAFSNAYAIEGHYFNFSTTGQWLWDEVRIPVPPENDPYETARRAGEIVERETRTDAAEAADDWERATRRQGKRDFSAAPTVNLQPGGGFEVLIRYVTRAPQRNAVKAKLLQEVAALLEQRASEAAG
jgi:hypothetical protein